MRLTPLEKDITVELNPARVKSTPVWVLQQCEHHAKTCYVSLERDGIEFEIPQDYIAVLHYKKPDGKEVIKYLVVDRDTVAIPFCEQMTAAAGMTVAQIIFVDRCDDVKLKTPLLYFSVVQGLEQGRIKSSSQYSILNKTLDKIRETFLVIPDVERVLKKVDHTHEDVKKSLRKANDANAVTEQTLKKAERLIEQTNEAMGVAKKATKTAEKAVGDARKMERKFDAKSKELSVWMKDAEETYITAKEIIL